MFHVSTVSVVTKNLLREFLHPLTSSQKFFGHSDSKKEFFGSFPPFRVSSPFIPETSDVYASPLMSLEHHPIRENNLVHPRQLEDSVSGMSLLESLGPHMSLTPLNSRTDGQSYLRHQVISLTSLLDPPSLSLGYLPPLPGKVGSGH